MKTRRERSWREGPHPRDHRSVLVHVRQRGRRRRFPALRREPARSSMSWRRIRPGHARWSWDASRCRRRSAAPDDLRRTWTGIRVI